MLTLGEDRARRAVDGGRDGHRRRIEKRARRWTKMAPMSASRSSRAPSTEHEIEEFLGRLEPRLAAHGRKLRGIVIETAPNAVERIRPGWGLIGYDLPATRQGAYFAWIWPEVEHVHIG